MSKQLKIRSLSTYRMSITRFTNPHIVLQQLQIVSRTDLYGEDDGPRVSICDIDSERLQSLPTVSKSPQLLNCERDKDDSLPRTKRRKVKKETVSDQTVRMYESTFGERLKRL